MKKCNLIPYSSEYNQSRLFRTVLNFANSKIDTDLTSTGIDVKSIRDLAIYIYNYSLTANLKDSGVALYEDTGEPTLDSVLAALIGDKQTPIKAKSLFTYMLDIMNTKVSNKYNPTITYDGTFTSSDISYSNLVLSELYLQIQADLSVNKAKTEFGLKRQILERLLKTINENRVVPDLFRDKYVKSYLTNIVRQDSIIWKSFISYLNNTYGVNYKNVRLDFNLEEREGTFQISEDIAEIWDAVEQDRIDRKNTISSVVKSKLALIFTNTNDNRGYTNKLYIPSPMDINTLWNQLINLHVNDITETDVYDSIVRASEQVPAFAKVKELFDAAARGDEDAINFKHAYLSGVKLAVIPSNILALDSDYVSRVITNNQNSFAETAYYNRFITVISTNLQYNLYNKSLFKSLKPRYVTVKDGSKTFFDKESTIDSLMDVYNKLGLDVSRDALNAYISAQGDTRTTYNQLINQAKSIISEVQNIIDKNITIDTYDSSFTNNLANLYNLAKVASYDFNSLTNLSYLDVKGKLNYSPQYDSLLTKMFRGLRLTGKLREDYLKDIFKDYLNDDTLNNNNLLWYDSRTGIGMFEKYVVNGETQIKVNPRFIQDFETKGFMNISQFDGLKLNDIGFKYKELQSTLYKFTEIMFNLKGEYVFLTSDSPRSYMMHIKQLDVKDLINKDGTYNSDHALFVGLRKIVENDINTFNTRGRFILSLNDKKAKDKKTLSAIHRTKYWNGKTVLNNGIPTGRAFQFLSLTYSENSKSVNLIKYIAQLESTENKTVTEQDIYSDIINQILNGVVGKYNLQYYVDGFVTRYIQYAQESVTRDFSDIAPSVIRYIIGNDYNVNNILNPTLAEEILHTYTELLQDFLRINKNPMIKTIDDIPQGLKNSKYEDAIKRILDNKDIASEPFYKELMLGVVLNHTIYNDSFNGLVYGNLSEYKNSIDFNKRISQVIKNGLNSIDTGKIRKILVVSDMEFKNNIADVLFRDKQGVEQQGRVNDEVANAYAKPATINDSQSIITDVGLEDLLKATGRWQEYKDIVTNLRNPNIPYNPNAYRKLIEQLKLFGTARRARSSFFKANPNIRDENGQVVNDMFATDVDSVQIKDSTIVLFKSSVAGTALEELYDWMTTNGVDQISPISAVKVSGITPITIHNENAQLVLPKTLDDTSVLYMKSSDFVIQQDIPADILDETVVLGNQFMKQLIQGLNMTEAIYKIDNGKKLTGREISNLFQQTISQNVSEDAINFIAELGGIDSDGKLYLNENGELVLSKNKLASFLQEIVMDDDSSQDVLKALIMDENGMTAMPLSSLVTFKKFERILASRFTKHVISQRLPGFHGPIRADIFNSSNILLSKQAKTLSQEEYDKAIDKLAKDGIITYADTFIEKCKAERRSLELQAEYGYDEEGNLIHRAEVIVSPWMKEFFQTIPTTKTITMSDGTTKNFITVDINQIPEEARKMFGIRIPTEGKQSMVLFEVVGFINTGATQAIFPQSLVTRTGWDFDIDSIYAYYKHINFKQGIYTFPQKSFNTEQARQREQANLQAKLQTLQNAYNRYKILPTTNSSYNSPNFLIVCNLFNSKYVNIEAVNTMITSITNVIDENISTLTKQTEYLKSKNNTKFTAQIAEIEDTIFKLKKVKDNINLGVKYLINEISGHIANYINSQGNGLKLLEAIKGSSLTQEERLAVTNVMTENYNQGDDKFLLETLQAINNGIYKVKSIFTKINKDFTSITTNENNAKYGITIDNYNTILETLSNFIKGDAKLKIGNDIRTVNIFEQLDKINRNIKEAVEKDFGSLKIEIDELNKLLKEDRQARENLILDITTAILGNVYHINDTNKPNAIDNIKAVSKRDNDLWNRSLESVNPNNLADKIFLNIVSMGSTVLKGHSVNFDNIAAILSNLEANMRKPVIREISIASLPDYYENGVKIEPLSVTGKSLNPKYLAYLETLYGKKNIQFKPVRKTIRVKDGYINNNAAGTNIDISGQKISFQLSEVTAAILDALKAELSFNLNIDTLSVFRLLSAGVTTEKLYLGNDTYGDINRFSFADALIQQPIIVDLIERLNIERISNPLVQFDKAIEIVRKEYSDKLMEYYLRNKTGDIQNDKLESLYRTGRLTKISKADIQDILSNINDTKYVYYNVKEFIAYTTEELISFIEDRNVDSGNIIAAQLAVLDMFADYNAKAETVKSLVFALKTESKVDSFYKADIRELRLADYYIDKTKYNKLLNDVYEHSANEIRTFAETQDDSKNVIETFNVETTQGFLKLYPEFAESHGRDFITTMDYYEARNMFSTLLTAKSRRDYINALNITYKQDSGFEIHGRDLIDAVFVTENNDYIDVNDGSFIDLTSISKYPIVFSRYQFGHWLYANAFGNIFAQRADLVKSAVSSYLIQTGKQNNESLRNFVTSRIIEFNSQSDSRDTVPLLYNVDRKTLQNLFGIITEEESNIHKGIIKELFNNINGEVTNEKLAKYTKLTLSEQIAFIQTEPSLKKYINQPAFKNSNIFKFIVKEPNSKQHRGFDYFRIIRDDNNVAAVNDMTDSVLAMWDSNIPYIAHTIRQLIAYTYYLEGFQFGYNISKYIPIELFTTQRVNPNYDTRLIQLGIPDIIVGLGDYSNVLYDAENRIIHGEVIDMQETFGYISRQNSDLNLQLPKENEQRRTFNKTLKVATMGYLMSKDTGNVGSTSLTLGDKTYKIIFETIERVANSRFANSEYVIQRNGRRGNTIFKRHVVTSINTSNVSKQVYFYYPIGKLLPNEFNDYSIIDDYNVPQRLIFDGREMSIDEFVSESIELQRFLTTLEQLEIERGENSTIIESDNIETNNIENQNEDEVTNDEDEVTPETITGDTFDDKPLNSKFVITEPVTTHISNSLTDTLNEVSKDADNIIFIGSKDSFAKKLFINKNAIIVDETKNPIDEARRIAKLIKNGKTVISGNSLENISTDGIGATQYANLFISKLYQLIGRIDSFNIILNDGFGTAISQIYIDVPKTIYSITENNDKLFSSFVKTERPEVGSIDVKMFDNAQIALTLFETLGKLQKLIRRKHIPNSDIIKKAYKSLNYDNYETNLESALKEEDKDAIIRIFEQMELVSSTTLEAIRELFEDINAINFDEIQGDYAKRTSYKKKLNTIRELLATFDNYRKLKTINIEDTIYDANNETDVESFEEEFKDINSTIKTLQALYNKSKKYSDDLLYKVQEIITDQFTKDSRNPNYTTAFKKLLEASRTENFDANTYDFESLKINKTEFLDIMNAVFTLKNMDISTTQRYLDSAFVTGVPVIDIIGKQYIKNVENARYKANAIMDEVEEALVKINPKFKDNGALREQYFKRFVDDYGQLISEYEYGSIAENIEELRSNISEVVQELLYNETFNITVEDTRSAMIKIDELIDNFNKTENATLTLVTGVELAELESHIEDMADNERIAYLKTHDYIELNYIESIDNTHQKTLFKLDFKEEAKSEAYKKLSQEDQEFISTIKRLIKETIQYYNPNFVPYASNFANILPYIPKASLNKAIANYLRIPKIRKDRQFEDIDGRKKYVAEAFTLQTPEVIYKFDIGTKPVGQTYTSFEEEVLERFNKWYNHPNNKYKVDYEIKSIKDIHRYNKEVEILNKQHKATTMSYDIYDIMKAFTQELFNVNAMNEFRVDYDLGLYSLLANDATTNIPKAMEQYKRIEANVFNASNVKSRLDRAASALLRYSSINFMYFNLTAGIKNVMKGISDMIIETSANNFVDDKSLRAGLAEIIKIAPIWIKELQQEKTENLYVAILKNFDDIYQDTTDSGASLSGSDFLTKVLSRVDTVGYSFNNMGEFLMQFGMLLACTKSHRVLNGKILSFNDWYDDSKIRIFNQIATPEQKREYYKFKELKDAEIERYEDKHNKKYNWQGDYIGEFLRANPELFSKEQKSEFNKLSKEFKINSKAEFEKLPTLESCLKVENGRLAYTEESKLTNDDLTFFRERVKGINQSLHGIYNRIDRMAIQDRAFDELFIQFRKWMRPNWNRHFGRRWMRYFFNETLGSWEVPIYKPAWDFLRYGIERFNKNNPNAKILDYIKGIFKIIGYYLEAIRNYKFYYNSMTISEQASVHKFMRHIAMFAGLAVTTLILGSLKDDDDEDENYAYTMMMYELTSLYQEVSEIVPIYGWYNTIDMAREKIFVGESMLQQGDKVIRYSLLGLIQDEDKLMYDRGIYKGQLKRDVALKRMIPILRQIEKQQNLKSTMNFYNYYNPFN